MFLWVGVIFFYNFYLHTLRSAAGNPLKRRSVFGNSRKNQGLPKTSPKNTQHLFGIYLAISEAPIHTYSEHLFIHSPTLRHVRIYFSEARPQEIQSHCWDHKNNPVTYKDIFEYLSPFESFRQQKIKKQKSNSGKWWKRKSLYSITQRKLFSPKNSTLLMDSTVSIGGVPWFLG